MSKEAESVLSTTSNTPLSRHTTTAPEKITDMCINAIVNEMRLLLSIPMEHWFKNDVLPSLRGDTTASRDALMAKLKEYVRRALVPNDTATEEKINTHFETRLCQMTPLVRVMCRNFAANIIKEVSESHSVGGTGGDMFPDSLGGVSATLSSAPLQTCGCNEFPSAREFWRMIRESVASLSDEDTCRLCVLTRNTQFDLANSNATFQKAILDAHGYPVMTEIAYNVHRKLLTDTARQNMYKPATRMEPIGGDANMLLQTPASPSDLKHPGQIGRESCDRTNTSSDDSISGASKGTRIPLDDISGSGVELLTETDNSNVSPPVPDIAAKS